MTSEPTEQAQRARRPGHLPPALLAAAGDRVHGAGEIAAQAIEGLLEAAASGDPELLEAGAAALLAGQPAMAPVWHVAMAARQPDPVEALVALRRRLSEETEAAARAAVAWLRAHATGPVQTVSESSLVGLTLRRLPQAEPGGAPDGGPAGHGLVRYGLAGLVGADAIGPAALLNATGTAALAAAYPTIVVATSIKLVPAGVFERLAAPGFERIPLERFSAVVLGAEVLDPAEAGRRAAAIG